MGRSVSYPSYTVLKAYQDIQHIENHFEFDNYIQDLASYAHELWPSYQECEVWLGREDRAILQNSFTYFGVSEYCGLLCVWISIKPDYEQPDLANAWCNRISKKFDSSFSELIKVAQFSNGESVYERKGVGKKLCKI